MTSAAELLRQHGITLTDTKPGRYYSVCPQCSKDRQKPRPDAVPRHHRRGDGRVRWGCNHCGWTGPEKGSGSFADADGQTFYFYRDREASSVSARCAIGGRAAFWLEQPDGKGGWKKGTKGVDTKIHLSRRRGEGSDRSGSHDRGR